MKKVLIMFGLASLLALLGEAFAWDAQLDNASVQMNSVLNQNITEADLKTKDLLRRKMKKNPRKLISISDTTTDEVAEGSHFHMTEEGSLLVRGGELNETGMSDIASSDNNGELQPVILLLQSDEPVKKEENVIRINAQTIKQLAQKKK